MSFERKILHHGSTPTGIPVILSMQAVKKCWFELNRQGGCGAGELILSNEFFDRNQIEIGDWISFEYADQERWYLGRVEERHAESPAQVRLRLQGMSIQLNEIFPGGFGEAADGSKPHRYAANQKFSHDPDRDIETFDSVASATEVVEKLIQQYVVPATEIIFDPDLLESPIQDAAVSSLKVRGEESVRSLMKELSTRAQGAAWGVNEQGKFFFLRRSNEAVAVYREGLNLTALSEIRDREFLFNRLLLTGDYIYDRREQSDMIARRSYRWRGNFVEPISRDTHGDKRIRLWLPWVRTQEDSLAFAKEFFRAYSQPVSRYLIEVDSTESLPKPWEGRFAVYDQQGELLTFSFAETVRVYFDQIPRLRMELGPLDPRELWAEPPQDERWELPDQHLSAGGELSLPTSFSSADPPPPPDPPQPPPPWSSIFSSTESSLLSSLNSSDLNSSLNSSATSSLSDSSEIETVESSSTDEAESSLQGGSSNNESTSNSADSSDIESLYSSAFSSNEQSSMNSSGVASESSLESSSNSNGTSLSEEPSSDVSSYSNQSSLQSENSEGSTSTQDSLSNQQPSNSESSAAPSLSGQSSNDQTSTGSEPFSSETSSSSSQTDFSTSTTSGGSSQTGAGSTYSYGSSWLSSEDDYSSEWSS